jgi:hypothetical protein
MSENQEEDTAAEPLSADYADGNQVNDKIRDQSLKVGRTQIRFKFFPNR